MDQLFVYFYPMVTVISIMAYLPQIKSLMTVKSSCSEIALSSWYLWMFSSAISIGYGAFHLKDFMFTLTCAVSFVLMAAVVGLVLYRRAEWDRLETTNALNA